MAINVGADATEVAPVNSTMTPKAGVVSQPAFLKGLSSMFDQADTILSNNRQSAKDRIAEDFRIQQLKVADALAQGAPGMTQARAASMLRLNLITAYEANRGSGIDFAAIQGQITGLTGGAKIISTGTKEEIRRDMRRDGLIRAGLLDSSASDPEFEAVESEQAVAAAALQEHQVRMQTLAEQKAVANLTEAQSKALVAEEERSTREVIIKSAPLYRRQFKTSLDKILAGPGTEAEKMAAVEGEWINLNSMLSESLGSLSSHKAKYLLKPFELMKEEASLVASGQRTIDEYERSGDKVLAFMRDQALMDPVLGPIISKSKLLPTLIFSEDSFLADSAFNRLFAAGTGDGPTKADEIPAASDRLEGKALTNYLKLLPQGASSPDKEVLVETEQRVRTLLSGVERGEGIYKGDPKEALTLMRWMSSPEFVQMRNQHPDWFSNIDGVKDILGKHVADEVWGMVKGEFRNNDIMDMQILKDGAPGENIKGGFGFLQEIPDGVGEYSPTPEAVGYETTADGMKFIPLDPDNIAATEKADALNKELKPIINQTLRAMAHLNGDTNYGAEWEKLAPQLLQNKTSGEVAAGGDAGDDLALEDFKFPTLSAKGLPKEVFNDTEFMDEVERLSTKYEIDPKVLLAVMDFETGGTFNPSQKNAAGSSGTGLIQFMASTAKGLGTSTDELAALSRGQQMKYVEKYLDQFSGKIHRGSAQDVYMAVLFPRAISKPDSYVLFKEGTTAYRQNKGLDKNGDGTVTKEEAAKAVVNLVGKY